jgi:hypothetical protein
MASACRGLALTPDVSIVLFDGLERSFFDCGLCKGLSRNLTRLRYQKRRFTSRVANIFPKTPHYRAIAQLVKCAQTVGRGPAGGALKFKRTARSPRPVSCRGNACSHRQGSRFSGERAAPVIPLPQSQRPLAHAFLPLTKSFHVDVLQSRTRSSVHR